MLIIFSRVRPAEQRSIRLARSGGRGSFGPARGLSSWACRHQRDTCRTSLCACVRKR